MSFGNCYLAHLFEVGRAWDKDAEQELHAAGQHSISQPPGLCFCGSPVSASHWALWTCGQLTVAGQGSHQGLCALFTTNASDNACSGPLLPRHIEICKGLSSNVCARSMHCLAAVCMHKRAPAAMSTLHINTIIMLLLTAAEDTDTCTWPILVVSAIRLLPAFSQG